MSENTTACQQAVFTSVRTPMGEGYRIIAASRGLRPEEKQAITRLSPSHNGLCPDENGSDNGSAPGVAFYTLPTKRLCVALSYRAGAEHTGRGGQRIYTHNAVIDPAEFEQWGYNPFNVIRAMIHAGLMSPQLKPPTVLEELELARGEFAGKTAQLTPHPSIGAGCGGHVLERLLDRKRIVLNLVSAWADSAEALLLGVPGPMRVEVALAAGLQFSVSRSHNLTLLSDPKGAVKGKVTGQPVEYVVPGGREAYCRSDRSWVSFVTRHWSANNLCGLAARTSMPLADVSAIACERIGRLYNCIDEVATYDSGKLLTMALSHLAPDAPVSEPDIVNELLDKTQCALRGKLGYAPWPEIEGHWPTLLGVFTGSDRGCAFAFPVIRATLGALAKSQAQEASRIALDLASTELPETVRDECDGLLEDVLGHLADWADGQPADELNELTSTLARWQKLRPESPAVERIGKRCEALEAELSASGSRQG